MRKFILGFICGAFLFGSLTIGASSLAPKVIGTGYLKGWSVEVEGTEVCDDPYISSVRTIECD